MKLQEIFDLVLVDSGQFLLGKDIEMNEGTFKIFMQSCISFYNKHNHHIKQFNVEFKQQGNGIFYEFKEDIPDVIFSANVQTWNNPHTIQHLGFDLIGNENFIDKRPQPITYEKPILYSTYLGVHDVKAGYTHKITYDELNGRKEYKIDTIDFDTDSHADFLEYITARFMITIGASRSAFTMSDIPLINNGAEMVQEGKEMRERAEQNIRDGGDWSHTWG